MNKHSAKHDATAEQAALADRLCQLAEKLSDNAASLCQCCAHGLDEAQINALQQMQEQLITQIAATQNTLHKLCADPLQQRFPDQHRRFINALTLFEERNERFIRLVADQRGLIDF